MTTNVPPEPDEFQTRMRQPEGDVEDTNRSGAPTGQPAQPGQPSPPAGPPAQPPFAPPGFGSASQSPQQPPTGYGVPPSQQPTHTFGAQSQPTQSAGQPGPNPNPWAQQQQPQGGGFAQQPQGGFPQAGYGQQQQPGQWGGAPQQPRDGNPLKAAFDFSFTTYATPGIVKIVYIVGIVLAALWYIGMIIVGFQAGAPRDYGYGLSSPGSAVPGILAILFAWIPAAFFVLALRLALEHVLSSVRTATDVRALRQRSDDAETKKQD